MKKPCFCGSKNCYSLDGTQSSPTTESIQHPPVPVGKWFTPYSNILTRFLTGIAPSSFQFALEVLLSLSIGVFCGVALILVSDILGIIWSK